MLNSNKNNYLIQLDGIRALAVVMVMISHFFWYRVVVLTPLGSMGVNIFFVLSGFLITRILLNAKDENELNNRSIWPSLKQFYFRRTLRIFPIYYLTIAALYIVNLPPTRKIAFWLYSYLMNIKFSMPGVWESNVFGRFSHFWSLCVEEQFYLFFPIFIFLIPKKYIKNFILSLLAIGLLTRLFLFLFDAPRNSLYVLTPTCLDAFAIGAFLSYLFLYDEEKLKQLLSNKKMFILACCLFILDIVISRNFINNYGECRTVLERFLFCVCCFYIVGLAATRSISGVLQTTLENKFVLYIGKISYGLYIYHNFIPDTYFSIVHEFPLKILVDINNNDLTKGIMYFVLSLIVASLSWYFVEFPISKLKKITFK